jgi:hypothetical protein
MLRRNQESKDIGPNELVAAFDAAHRQMVIDHRALDGAYEVEINQGERSVVYIFTINTGIQRVHRKKFDLMPLLRVVEQKRMHPVLEDLFYKAWGDDLLTEANTTNRFDWIPNVYD